MTDSPRKTKILLVTTSDRMAGAEKNIVDLLTHINREKYEPRLVVFQADPNGQLVTLAKELGVSAECIGIQKKWQFYKLYKLIKIIRSFKPDILESYLFFDNQVCRIFGKLFGIKAIISGQQNVETKRSWLRNVVDRLTIRFADKIISNTDAGGQWYVNHRYVPQGKICIAKNGVDIEKLHVMQAQHLSNGNERIIFGYGVPKNAHAIVSVGFLTEQKGVVYLLDALKILKEQNIAVQSFIIGDGILRQSLEQHAAAIGVAEMVHFVGFQKASYQYLHLFDAFVMPSLWEGLPNVLIEAMASKIPVISTAVGGISEVIIDDTMGMLIPAGNSAALADAIKREIALSATEREAIITTAFNRVQNYFSVQSMVASYEDCYEELLKNN